MADGTATVGDAVANNAAWCDLVCRTHGVTGVFAVDAWTAPVRTPLLYPDAVVLRPDADPRSVLDRIEGGPGASVKDSFATLDLAPFGFRVLFDATWIARSTTRGALTGTTAALAPVAHDGFATWEAAWRGADGPVDVLRPTLLDDPGVTALAASDGGGAIATGAVLFASTEDVVGVANVFVDPSAPDVTWQGIVAWAAMHHPGATLVGYESGPDLAAAWRVGFEPIAPLRVWVRD